MGDLNRSLFSSKSHEWETPLELFKECDREFHFNLDVCATKKNTKCKKFFTKEQDGLKQSWKGTAWCNPPYGREITAWIVKAFLEMTQGNTVVCLLPARTDTRWFHYYIYNRPWAKVKFLRGRIKFNGHKNSAPFPSMIVVFKKNIIAS